jgi:hypothetical protein
MSAMVRFVAALLLLCAGCGTICVSGQESGPTIRFEGGLRTDGVYQSSDWTGPLLPYPAGRRYDIVHGLGVTPRLVQIYLAGSSKGVNDGTVSLGGGDSSTIELVTEEIVRIHNNTCGSFFVLVSAVAPGP